MKNIYSKVFRLPTQLHHSNWSPSDNKMKRWSVGEAKRNQLKVFITFSCFFFLLLVEKVYFFFISLSLSCSVYFFFFLISAKKFSQQFVSNIFLSFISLTRSHSTSSFVPSIAFSYLTFPLSHRFRANSFLSLRSHSHFVSFHFTFFFSSIFHRFWTSISFVGARASKMDGNLLSDSH